MNPRNRQHEDGAGLGPRRWRLRRAGTLRILSACVFAGALALVLMLLAPDRDAATRAVARTRHPAESVLFAPHPAAISGSLTFSHVFRPGPALPNLPVEVVTFAPRSASRQVPSSFLGISTEYWALPFFENQPSLFERALSLFTTPDQGPLVLRIGGDSADHTFWGMKPRTAPPWVVRLSPALLSQLGALVDQLGAKLILDLNLVTDSPLTAAQWARAAATGLPRGGLVGFEVGNEPDLYRRRYWEWAISHPTLGMTVLPKDLSPATYVRDFEAYSDALDQAAPDIPLVGPAVANPASDFDWVSTLMASDHPRLGMVSGHVYPYSACARRSKATYPTIARVLSENASAGIAERIEPAVRLAHSAGLPFRLTEMNSVTCGGLSGVSDTFATALWAPDALFEMLRAGVDGVNIHVRARAINAAFALSRREMTARPLMYGLMLFNRTLGPGARLTAVQVYGQGRRAPRLKVWAVHVNGGGLHVLIIDKSNRAANVDLRIPTAGPASVQRLLAPSVGSRSGVTLAGQHVGADASWHGARVTETVWPGRRGYVVTVPQMSAALVGMRLAAPKAAPVSAAGHAVETARHRTAP